MSNKQRHSPNLPGLLADVRARKPLVHQITNYVTANDCANAVLALGGSPVMADDPDEVCEVVAPASALVLNLGTLNSRTIQSMLLAGHEANRRGIPVILDPVGAGATSLRTATARQLAAALRPAVVRGNLSEIMALAGLPARTRGVDSDDDQTEAQQVARQLAARLSSVVAVTGAQDVVSDGQETWLVSNGHPWLARITGSGCMLSALIGACCGVTHDHLSAALAGVVAMGLAGEQAAAAAAAFGLGSFRVALLDRLSQLSPQRLQEGAKIDVA